MAYNWNDITNELMINLFLYGQSTTPTDLASDQLIRPTDNPEIANDYVDYIHIDINMAGFMTEGPGRFASAALSPLVQKFLGLFRLDVSSFPPGTETATGGHSLTAEQLYIAMGVPSGVGISVEDTSSPTGRRFVHEGFTIRESNYIDGNLSDVGLRTYIYHSVNFGFSENTRFIIEADGTRHITNLGIVPLQDNFDFEGAGFTAILGDIAEAQVDPSGIGRKVYMDYVNPSSVPVISDYTVDSYIADSAKDLLHFRPDVGWPAATVANEQIVLDLFDKGVTSFLDEPHPILYGKVADDVLSADQITTLSAPLLFHYLSLHENSGVTLIGGAGNDSLTGGIKADRLIGGADNDTLKGWKGNDTLEGSTGFDTYIYTSGDGFDAFAVTGRCQIAISSSRALLEMRKF